jgi:C-terminal processing protease CtpA/Prc
MYSGTDFILSCSKQLIREWDISGIGAVFMLCPRTGARIVQSIAEGSTAESAGLEQGDVIQKVLGFDWTTQNLSYNSFRTFHDRLMGFLLII